MNRREFDMFDAPYFDTGPANLPDYRKEAFEQARKNAKTFGFAHILYNGLYYHVTSSDIAVTLWKRKGYKVIHTETI